MWRRRCIFCIYRFVYMRTSDGYVTANLYIMLHIELILAALKTSRKCNMIPSVLVLARVHRSRQQYKRLDMGMLKSAQSESD